MDGYAEQKGSLLYGYPQVYVPMYSLRLDWLSIPVSPLQRLLTLVILMESDGLRYSARGSDNVQEESQKGIVDTRQLYL